MPTSMAAAPAASASGGQTAYGAAVLVRGTESCIGEQATASSPDPIGVSHVRDFRLTCAMRFNDPRVSGNKSGPMSMDGWGPASAPDAIVEWTSSRLIENEGGAWVGRLAGVYTTETGDMLSAWFEGTGGYAGLSFFEWVTAPVGAATTGYPVVGLIFPGGSPTLPDLGPMPSPARAAIPPSLPPVPSSAPVAYGTGAGTAYFVRGMEICESGAITIPSPDPDGVVRVRDASLPCIVAFNDPRVSGTNTGPWNADAWGGATGAIVEWGSPRRIENAGGAWVGSLSGVHTTETGDMLSAWFEGTGGYAGLSFFEWIACPQGTATSACPVVGLIYPGSIPRPESLTGRNGRDRPWPSVVRESHLPRIPVSTLRTRFATNASGARRLGESKS